MSQKYHKLKTIVHGMTPGNVKEKLQPHFDEIMDYITKIDIKEAIVVTNINEPSDREKDMIALIQSEILKRA